MNQVGPRVKEGLLEGKGPLETSPQGEEHERGLGRKKKSALSKEVPIIRGSLLTVRARKGRRGEKVASEIRSGSRRATKEKVHECRSIKDEKTLRAGMG